MLSTSSQTVEAADSATPPRQNSRVRWFVRIGLFLVHIGSLAGAASLTPGEYAFQFGFDAGSIVLVSTMFLWILLWAARTRGLLALFCALALAQVGCVALLGLHFQAEDRALRPMMEAFKTKRAEWTSRLERFQLDALFEMSSGKRQLSITDLQELRTQAQDGQAEVDQVKADVIRSRSDTERHISAVSPRAARSFRQGVETTGPLYEKEMDLLKEHYAECEQMLTFLIARQGQFSQTSEGLRFKKAEDAETFDQQIGTIERTQKELASVVRQLPQD